jgi:two-component system, LytTR family, sensor kinase
MLNVPGRPDPSHERVPLRRTDLLLIFAFWTLIALLGSANYLIDPRGRGLQPVLPLAPVAMAFIEAYIWATLTPVVFWIVSRHGIERTHRAVRAVMFLALGLMIAVAVDQILYYFRFEVFFVPRRPPRDVTVLIRVQRMWFMNELIVFLAIVAAGFARDYFLRYRARREEAVRLQAHTAHLQAQLADARLAALRAQLNPHFLFNTLHAVSALVERDPRGVRRMIARLSELLRTTLEGADEPEVPLSQELTFLRRYLEIMQIRFQGRLEVDTRIAPDAEGALVPNLILQPLVENALEHGIDKRDAPGRVEIEARLDGDRVRLTVRDNGPGLETGTTEGVGLTNTRARLEQLYGAEQSLELRAAEGGGLTVEISLPFHTRDDLRTAAIG